jgi:hypothetical protein
MRLPHLSAQVDRIAKASSSAWRAWMTTGRLAGEVEHLLNTASLVRRR